MLKNLKEYITMITNIIMNFLIDNKPELFSSISNYFTKSRYRVLLMCIFVYKYHDISRYVYYIRNTLIYGNFRNMLKSVMFSNLIKIPYIKNKVDAKINEFNKKIESDFKENQGKLEYNFGDSLNFKGCKPEDIKNKLLKLKESSNVDLSKVSGTVYNDKEELDLVKDIYPIFYKSNPLHPDIFPEISVIEKNIIQIAGKLFNGDVNTCGCMTSGGTESILMACYAYKKLGYDKKGITKPEIILPVTAHAAFDKAADYFSITLHKIPINFDTYQLDIDFLVNSINNNTIAIVGSAPSFSHGIMDPIEKMSSISDKYEIPMHVDACLGGFLLPFMENKKFKYDFELPGVTSISADTHKYGYSPKGSSLILYKNEEYFKKQIFVEENWNGGIYATPTILGSKSGNNIVLTWATINYYGYLGYKQRTDDIINTTNTIVKELKKINDIFVFGNPEVNVIGIGSKTLNIYQINQEMIKRGWNLNELQLPESIHLCVTLNHCNESMINKFLEDISISITEVKESDKSIEECASVYGSTQKIPDRTLIRDIAKHYIKLLSNT